MEFEEIRYEGFEYAEREKCEPIEPYIDKTRKAVTAFFFSLSAIVFCAGARQKKRRKISFPQAGEFSALEGIAEPLASQIPKEEPKTPPRRPIVQIEKPLIQEPFEEEKLFSPKQPQPIVDESLNVPKPLSPQAAPAENIGLCTEEDQKKILEIVDILYEYYQSSASFWGAAKGSAEFATKTPRLLQYKKEIKHVHPFDFLLTIFQKAGHRSKVKAMFDGQGQIRDMMWKGFTDGVNEGLNEQRKQDNLSRHLDTFASKLRQIKGGNLPSFQEEVLQTGNNLVIHLIKQFESPLL